MFITDDIVFLEMEKTGSTFATDVLETYCGGRLKEKHSSMRDHRDASKIIVSSVRNPWDWYVSMWAFSCSAQGELHHYFRDLPRSEFRRLRAERDFPSLLWFFIRTLTGRPDWMPLFSDPFDRSNFRKWLRLMLGREGQHIGARGYAASPVKTVAGYMTFRFLGLTTDYNAWIRVGRKCRTYKEIERFAENHSIAQKILRMEHLNEDLADLLVLAGVDVSVAALDEWRMANVSQRYDYRDYYDDPARELVRKRDRFIVDRFGYTF